MKTIITGLLLTLTTINGSAQNPLYQQKMGEALSEYAQSNSKADYEKAAANFERIASIETQEWLPLYYYAQAYTMIAFSNEGVTNEQKDAYLDLAQGAIQQLIEMQPKESEVYTLQALLHTARLMIDPVNRGQKYSSLANSSIQKALTLEPTNPRARQMNLSNKMGTARFFQQDVSIYCQEANDLLNEWDEYTIASPFHPNWGKEQVQNAVQECSLKESTPKESENKVRLTIEIEKLKSNDGQVLLELLDENENVIQQRMAQIDSKKANISFDNLEKGSYAVRYFHDANGNGKMDTNKYGIPKENYGFSNNARGFMSAPKYKKLLFDLNENTSIRLKTK